jgi:DNA-directed RNA polymerase specialized sigma24 family protein
VPSSSPALCGDESQLFAAHDATLRARVCRYVNTSTSNVDDACSFAWMQPVRRQPRRHPSVLPWLTTVAIHEARPLDQAERRRAPLEAAGEPSTLSTTLTYEQAREALEVAAALPPRQRQLVGLHAAGFTYHEIAQLSRVADVASVEAAVVSIDDMSSTRVNAVYRFECVSGSDLVDGVALDVRPEQARRRCTGGLSLSDGCERLRPMPRAPAAEPFAIPGPRRCTPRR